MSLQWMDEEEGLVNMNTYREDNKSIEYYYNSLQDPTSNSDGKAQNYLITPRQRIRFKRENDELNQKLLALTNNYH